jgi:hypothetical protein
VGEAPGAENDSDSRQPSLGLAFDHAAIRRFEVGSVVREGLGPA